MDYSLIIALLITAIVIFLLPAILKPTLGAFLSPNNSRTKPTSSSKPSKGEEKPSSTSSNSSDGNNTAQGSSSESKNTQSSEPSQKRENSKNKEEQQLLKEDDSTCCGQCDCKEKEGSSTTPLQEQKGGFKILYGTQTGESERWARKLAVEGQKRGYKTEISNLSEYDPDDLSTESTVVFLISTYTGGSPPESCVGFFRFMEDVAHDFREDRNKFKNLHYAVFGLGNSVYGRDFNAVAKKLDRMFLRLAGQRLVHVGLGDNDAGVEVDKAYSHWSPKLWAALDQLFNKPVKVNRSNTAIKTSEDPDEDSEGEKENSEPLTDLEDLGKFMKKSGTQKKAVQKTKPSARKPSPL